MPVGFSFLETVTIGDVQTAIGPYMRYLRKYGPQPDAYRVDDPDGVGPGRESVWTRLHAARISLGTSAVYNAIDVSAPTDEFWVRVRRSPIQKSSRYQATSQGVDMAAKDFIDVCERLCRDPLVELTLRL